MLRTNRDCVCAMAVEGKPKYPIARNWIVNLDGTNNMGIGCSGIHYNVKVGDGVGQFEGDHVEPGVTKVYYRHSYDAEKRLALDAWARRLEAIVTNEKVPKIVPLRAG